MRNNLQDTVITLFAELFYTVAGSLFLHVFLSVALFFLNKRSPDFKGFLDALVPEISPDERHVIEAHIDYWIKRINVKKIDVRGRGSDWDADHTYKPIPVGTKHPFAPVYFFASKDIACFRDNIYHILLATYLSQPNKLDRDLEKYSRKIFDKQFELAFRKHILCLYDTLPTLQTHSRKVTFNRYKTIHVFTKENPSSHYPLDLPDVKKISLFNRSIVYKVLEMHKQGLDIDSTNPINTAKKIHNARSVALNCFGKTDGLLNSYRQTLDKFLLFELIKLRNHLDKGIQALDNYFKKKETYTFNDEEKILEKKSVLKLSISTGSQIAKDLIFIENTVKKINEIREYKIFDFLAKTREISRHAEEKNTQFFSLSLSKDGTSFSERLEALFYAEAHNTNRDIYSLYTVLLVFLTEEIPTIEKDKFLKKEFIDHGIFNEATNEIIYPLSRQKSSVENTTPLTLA